MTNRVFNRKETLLVTFCLRLGVLKLKIYETPPYLGINLKSELNWSKYYSHAMSLGLVKWFNSPRNISIETLLQ